MCKDSLSIFRQLIPSPTTYGLIASPITCDILRYNPLGDNPHKFCELCGSDTPGVRCTDRDPYADYAGALNCLREKGDIAFLNDKVTHN